MGRLDLPDPRRCEDDPPDAPPYSDRCPVCEGLDYPGLNHNPDAPYCTEAPELMGKRVD